MAEATTTAGDAPTAVAGHGSALERFALDREGGSVLSGRRSAAWEEFVSLPMPTRKSEEWRYTDLSELDPEAFAPVGEESPRTGGEGDLPEEVRATLEADRERSAVLVLRNGVVEHVWIDPVLAEQGVVWAPISEIAESRPGLLEEYFLRSDVAPHERKLWSLHVAALSNGYVLHVPEGVTVPDPVHALRWLDAEGALVSTHSLIVADAGAEVTVVDEYLSADLAEPSLSLNGVEIFGSDEAVVHYLALQRYGKGVRHFSMQHSNTGRDSSLDGLNVTIGGDLSRCDVTSHLLGPGAESEMLALWFGDGTQHFDHHTLQNHAAPHARSDLLYKGALTGSARSVFRGLIRVAEGAQLTDAYQTNRNLLLSEDAHATALPNLEIAADDVRCSHGATVGQVDESQLFYLRSRGLERRQAERLLVFGFFHEVLGRIPMDGVRERIEEAIERKIGLLS